MHEKRHRTVVGDLNELPLAKEARKDIKSRSPQSPDESIEARPSIVRRRSARERRATPTGRVSAEGELGHSQHRPTDVNNRQVHLTIVVIEDPQRQTFSRDLLRLSSIVTLLYSSEQYQAGTDCPPRQLCATDGGVAHALQQDNDGARHPTHRCGPKCRAGSGRLLPCTSTECVTRDVVAGVTL
jgi:hypothetical protein